MNRRKLTFDHWILRWAVVFVVVFVFLVACWVFDMWSVMQRFGWGR